MKIAVLGGFGAMAEGALYYLAQNPKVKSILAVDIDLTRANSLLKSIPQSKKIKPVKLDISNLNAASQALKGSDCLLNCSWYEFNLSAMDLSLALNAHYIDLGGLYHMTLKQLKKNEEFKRAKRLAVLGMGSAPGLSNLMASHIAKDFDSIDTLGIYDASFDPALDKNKLIVPFSIKTLLDEHGQKAPILLNGKPVSVSPHSLAEEIDFKKPLGRMKVGTVIHSETATLPHFLKSKKIKNLFFKIGYPPPLKTQLEILEAAGFSSDRPIYLNGQAISPKSFLAAMAQQNARNLSPTNGRDFEILRVKASGISKGKCLEKILDCEMSGNGKISAGTLGVGVPAAIAALMMIEGKTLISSGAAAPEEALNPISVIKELERLQTFNFVETVTKPI